MFDYTPLTLIKRFTSPPVLPTRQRHLKVFFEIILTEFDFVPALAYLLSQSDYLFKDVNITQSFLCIVLTRKQLPRLFELFYSGNNSCLD